MEKVKHLKNIKTLECPHCKGHMVMIGVAGKMGYNITIKCGKCEYMLRYKKECNK